MTPCWDRSAATATCTCGCECWVRGREEGRGNGQLVGHVCQDVSVGGDDGSRDALLSGQQLVKCADRADRQRLQCCPHVREDVTDGWEERKHGGRRVNGGGWGCQHLVKCAARADRQRLQHVHEDVTDGCGGLVGVVFAAEPECPTYKCASAAGSMVVPGYLCGRASQPLTTISCSAGVFSPAADCNQLRTFPFLDFGSRAELLPCF